MPTLRELQQQFDAALFDGADDALSAEIVANGIAPAERIEIYRNTLREGFAKALAIAYPVIQRLVGEPYFHQLAIQFQKAHPSRAGDLHHASKPFPAFLREQFAATEYAYLADVAALEWAHGEALIAPDAEPITVAALPDVDPARYEHLRFDLHPSCAWVRSDYPIVRIWRANQRETTSEEIIDLRAGGDAVLVLRTLECVEFHSLSVGELAALEALSRGETLGAVLEATQAADAGFDIGEALGRFMTLRIFVGVRGIG